MKPSCRCIVLYITLIPWRCVPVQNSITAYKLATTKCFQHPKILLLYTSELFGPQIPVEIFLYYDFQKFKKMSKSGESSRVNHEAERSNGRTNFSNCGCFSMSFLWNRKEGKPERVLDEELQRVNVVENNQNSISERNDTGDYVLTERKLGEGGYSTVYVGIRKSDNLNVAVKIFKNKKAKDPTAYEEEVQKEVSIMQKLRHPNIIELYDHFHDLEQHRHLLFLEYAQGGELFDRIVLYSHFSEQKARDIFVDMCASVKYCHDQQVVHRDIKPENFLLTRSDQNFVVKLADFGLSFQVQPGVIVSEDCGTPEYMSPEAMQRFQYTVNRISCLTYSTYGYCTMWKK